MTGGDALNLWTYKTMQAPTPEDVNWCGGGWGGGGGRAYKAMQAPTPEDVNWCVGVLGGERGRLGRKRAPQGTKRCKGARL